MSVQNIYNKLKAAIGNDFGVCGLMGNLKAESNMQANNLQNTYNTKLGMSDEEYTKAVDNGSYTNFVNDSAGYGLVQWTFWTRKNQLLTYAKAVGKSIGDEDMQLEFMLGELSLGYTSVFDALKNAKSVREASDVVLTKYEKPADQSTSVQIKRAEFGEEFYKQFVGGTVMSEEIALNKDGKYTKGVATKLSASFASNEFDCKGKGCCSTTLVDAKLIKYLQQIRDHFGVAITIHSGYRCDKHNKAVDGASKSKHKYGQAADIKIKGVSPLKVAQYAESIGIRGIGQYPTFTHIDTRTNKFFWYGSSQKSRSTFGKYVDETKKTETKENEGSTSSPVVNVGGNGMKYNINNKPLVCMQTTSRCYKNTKKMTVKGVLWHSTGANNPTLKRYVQPSNNASDREYWLNLLGKNQYGNDINHANSNIGMNCWIGQLADGTVTTVQTMPWDYRPWGCGSGNKGSCNDGWIQFEICEDSLNDKEYFDKVYAEACQITAYLCNMYNLNPHGYNSVGKVKVPVILCHADSNKLGLGTAHGDVYNWFNKYGKTMDDVRNDVAALMKSGNIESTAPVEPAKPIEPKPDNTAGSNINVGDVVQIVEGAVYYTGKQVPTWVRAQAWIVKSINGDRAVIDKSSDGTMAICSPVNVKYLKPINKIEKQFEPYVIRSASTIEIYNGAGMNYDRVGVAGSGAYTIVEEALGEGASKWGRLKSGLGWISLDLVEKI